MAEMVEVENINTPGVTSRVNAAKYRAMREAYLATLTEDPPGQTQAELMPLVKQSLPSDLFPGGKTSGWWLKTVQLDLEAKGLVARSDTRPLRWFQTPRR